MKLVVHSGRKSEDLGVGWHKAGDDIAYFANGIRKSVKFARSLYTLRFSYTFEYSDDIVYFAYSYPYTYSQLTDFLNKLEADQTITEYPR